MYGPKMFDLFYLFDLLRWERVPNPQHEMAAGASHPRQRYIRDSCCHSGWQSKTYVKPEAAITFFELLMMGGVSPETC